MKSIIQIMPLFVLSLTLISCGGDSGGGSDPVPQEEQTTGGTTTGGTTVNFDVTLDSELTSAERTSVKNSNDVLESLQIDGSKISGFSKIFGGNRTSHVVDYLERRVNYFLSQYTDYRSRLVLNPLSLMNKLDFFAANNSVYIWYTALINQPNDVRIQINNRNIDINSSHIGVINLGNIYTQYDAITQAITIVHEARHSDCPDGALTSEIFRWYNGLEPINHTCGQLHGVCPDGVNYCDVIPWGAYAIDYIYSLTVANTCSSCTETERQQAQANANMVQNSAFDINGTMNGVHGPPDMGNSNQIRDDL